MMKRSPLGLCLAAVVFQVAGCAQPATTGAAPPSPALPAAQTPGQDALLLYAEDLLIGRCMARSGLEFTAVRPSGAALRETVSRPFGTDDVAYARAHGYGFSDGEADGAGAQDDPNQQRLQDAPPAVQMRYQQALYGAPDELGRVPLAGGRTLVIAVRGCVADARRQLYGDVQTYVMADFVANNLEAHIAQGVRDDPGYVRALSAWRACVAAHGLPVADPEAARQAGARAAQAGGRTAEVTVALTDAGCARSSVLVPAATAAERGLWRRVDAGSLRQVVTYRSLRAAALPAARDVTQLGG